MVVTAPIPQEACGRKCSDSSSASTSADVVHINRSRSSSEELCSSVSTTVGSPCGNAACEDSFACENVVITEEDLDCSMAEVAFGVRPWDSGSFSFVKPLEEASRNYGHVNLMTVNGRQVAVKRMPLHWVGMDPMDFEAKHAGAQEKPWQDMGLLNRLNELQYPYVCNLLGVFADAEDMYVATSLASVGDLFSWTFGTPGLGREREAWIWPMASQAFDAIRWLHNLGISHRDISLENLLLEEQSDGTLQLKVIDFAMSSVSRPCVGIVGKPSYRPPEMHACSSYDPFLADSFALGVSLFTMAARDYPWNSTKLGKCELFSYVAEHGFAQYMSQRPLRKSNNLRMAEGFSQELLELLAGLLTFKSQRRFCLGENCFAKEQTSARRSVWTCPRLVAGKALTLTRPTFPPVVK